MKALLLALVLFMTPVYAFDVSFLDDALVLESFIWQGHYYALTAKDDRGFVIVLDSRGDVTEVWEIVNNDFVLLWSNSSV